MSLVIRVQPNRRTVSAVKAERVEGPQNAEYKNQKQQFAHGGTSKRRLPILVRHSATGGKKPQLVMTGDWASPFSTAGTPAAPSGRVDPAVELLLVGKGTEAGVWRFRERTAAVGTLTPEMVGTLPRRAVSSTRPYACRNNLSIMFDYD